MPNSLSMLISHVLYTCTTWTMVKCLLCCWRALNFNQCWLQWHCYLLNCPPGLPKAGDSFNLLEVSLILLLKLKDIPWSISRQLLSENGKSKRSVWPVGVPTSESLEFVIYRQNCTTARVWHFGIETSRFRDLPIFFRGFLYQFRETWKQKKVLVSKNLVSEKSLGFRKYGLGFGLGNLVLWMNKSEQQERDKNKSKGNWIMLFYVIVCCWKWYWFLNLRTSIIKKGLLMNGIHPNIWIET